MATAYFNAAVQRLHNEFLDAVEAALAGAGITASVRLLKADGGAVPLTLSRREPVQSILSGPAASVMAKFGRGLICLPMAPEIIDRLQLPLMTQRNGSRFGTNFTISIEARDGVTTGISAADRATTILAAVADNVRPDDIVTPGHIFPLRAKVGGVLSRAGQTEGGVDLSRLAGLKPASVICEIMTVIKLPVI